MLFRTSSLDGVRRRVCGISGRRAIAIFGLLFSFWELSSVINYLVDTFKRRRIGVYAQPLCWRFWDYFIHTPESGDDFPFACASRSLVWGGTDGHGQYPGHRCNSPASTETRPVWFSPGRGYSVCCAASCWDIMQAGIFLSSSRFIFWIFVPFRSYLVSMVEVCFRALLGLPLLSFDRFLLFPYLDSGFGT